jgi:hypothetical protein
VRVSDAKKPQLADTLAEVGRRVGQAMTDAMERVRPAFDAVTDVANRPEVRAMWQRAEEVLRHRPCLCMCMTAHPADFDICETFDAVMTGRTNVGAVANVPIPLCAPCAAARAAREFVAD